jgi:hypothetical protein
MDGVGLLSARDSYGLQQTTVISPARQQSTSVWDIVDNDDASSVDGVFVLMILSSGFWWCSVVTGL